MLRQDRIERMRPSLNLATMNVIVDAALPVPSDGLSHVFEPSAPSELLVPAVASIDPWPESTSLVASPQELIEGVPMATKKKTTPKKAKAPKAAKPAFGAKSDFVRAQPLDMSAKQVVEEALKKGITLTEGLVYNVRGAVKKGTDKASTAASPRKAKAAARPVAASPKTGGLEAQLRMAIAELGLAQARSIFADVEKAFSGR